MNHYEGGFPYKKGFPIQKGILIKSYSICIRLETLKMHWVGTLMYAQIPV